MLYRFILLGQIPGTNFQLTFYQIMAGILLILAYFGLRYYYPVLRFSFKARLNLRVAKFNLSVQRFKALNFRQISLFTK